MVHNQSKASVISNFQKIFNLPALTLEHMPMDVQELVVMLLLLKQQMSDFLVVMVVEHQMFELKNVRWYSFAVQMVSKRIDHRVVAHHRLTLDPES